MPTASRIVLLALLGPVLAAALVWAALALWFDGSTTRVIAAGLAIAFAALCLWALVRVRPLWRAAVAVVAAFVVVLAWWLRIPARNDRDWLPDVANAVTVERNGDAVTIHNIRNFDYRSETDFTPHWETRTYDLSALRGVDLFMSYWGSPSIAHTILSWDFADGRPLAVSIETRKETGESYSAVRGFFRQYELYYVFADERDVIGLRTNHRGERVYLYRLRVPLSEARAVLEDYLEDANRLAREPRWYNALTQNCTTTIRMHRRNVARTAALNGGTSRPVPPFDWRILVNGYGDELMYERKMIDTSMPFAEMRAASDVTERAKAAGTDPEFARRVREGLPGGERRALRTPASQRLRS